MDANVESLHNLEQNLKSQGYDLMTIPYVLQFNKRDLPNIVPVEEMKQKLVVKAEPVLEAIATELAVTARTVGKWRRRFRRSGPDGLLDVPAARSPPTPHGARRTKRPRRPRCRPSPRPGRPMRRGRSGIPRAGPV